MAVAGIIAEYDPLHRGHSRLFQAVRTALGQETPLVCVMSGNFVQRGDFAVADWRARGSAALDAGVNLVLELPLPWAVQSAEGFARGGVAVLDALGCVTHLAFGCECGDAAPLMEIAACLDTDQYQAALRPLLTGGRTYAACRQSAVETLLGSERAALLDRPNNNLAVEYGRALRRIGSRIQPLAIRRTGAAHDSAPASDGTASGSWIRHLLHTGERETALALMTPGMAAAYRREEDAGRAPVFWEICERAILYRLRSMSEEEYAVLDSGREGLYRRLYRASRTADTLSELLTAAKTKRCTLARLRRMVLWAWLELPACPETIPCLRLLAADAVGCRLLASVRKTAAVPVVTKPAAVRKLSPDAQALFDLTARAERLYALAYPRLSSGSLWETGPILRRS